MRRFLTGAGAIAMALAFALPANVQAFSTSGRCLGLMVQTSTIELRPGFWSVGSHTISVRYLDPLFEVDDVVGPATFTVDESADMYPGQVRVDQDGLFRGYLDVPGQTINPAQDTVLWAAWAADMTGELFGVASTMRDLKADLAAGAQILFSIDGGEWVAGRLSPFHAACANGALGGTNDIPLFHRTWGGA